MYLRPMSVAERKTASESQAARWPKAEGFDAKLFVLVSLAYVAAIPLENYQGALGFSVTAILAAATMAIWGYSRLRGSHTGRSWRVDTRATRPLWWAIAILMGYWALTLSWAGTSLESLYGSTFGRYATFTGLALMVPILTRAMAVSGDAAIRVFVLSATVLALLNAAQLNGGDQVTVAQQNENGLALVLTLALGWSVMLSLRTQKLWRFVFALSSVVLLVGALGTGSRTGAIAAIAAIGSAVALNTLRRESILSALLTAVSLLVLMLLALRAVAPLLPERLSNLAENLTNLEAWSGRSELWSGALYYRDEWIWSGVGLGQSRMFSALFFDRYQVLHNSFLEVAVQTGIVGLILFVSVGITAAVIAFRGKNTGPYLVAAIAVLPFMLTLSAEYYKSIWLLPAVAAAGIPLVSRARKTKGRAATLPPAYRGL